MKDNEIIKALECCTNDDNEPNCKECTKRPHIYCICELLEDAYGLIKRQQERMDRIVEQLEEEIADNNAVWKETEDDRILNCNAALNYAIAVVKGVQNE